jgi:hypothetical protein
VGSSADRPSVCGSLFELSQLSCSRPLQARRLKNRAVHRHYRRYSTNTHPGRVQADSERWARLGPLSRLALVRPVAVLVAPSQTSTVRLEYSSPTTKQRLDRQSAAVFFWLPTRTPSLRDAAIVHLVV